MHAPPSDQKTTGTTGTTGTTLATLAAAQFAVTLSTSIVNVALPAVRDGIGLSDTGLSWVVNAYGLAFGALLLLGGRAADLLGRRRVLAAGLALFSAAAVAAGLASTPWMLIAARTAQGAGAAAIAPAALSLTMRLHPPGPARAKALGVWGAVSGAGGAAGVLLGGVLTQGPGWPWVFHASGIGAGAVLAATLRLVPADPKEAGGPRPRLDLAGSLTATAGLVSLVYGLTAAGRAGWTDPLVFGPLGAAAALLALFALVERRHPAPLLPPGLLTRGAVAPANLVMALLGAVWVGLFFFLPLYQQQVLGAGPLEAGLSQLPLAAANMLGSGLAPVLARRIGPHRTLLAGLATQAAGFLWLARIPADGTFLIHLLGPVLLIGVGLGVAFVQLTGSAVSGVEPSDAGLAGGLVNTTRQIGGAVGLAVLGTLAAARTASAPPGLPHAAALTEGYRAAFLLSAAVLALGATLTPLLARGTRRAPESVPTPPPFAAPCPSHRTHRTHRTR
ncbi:MFS transporter [Streptomyces sp. PCS3-D2]|uniref:MFS transporter n=1 Tax=Streptomyces sp. PCS3-D2 TaxID=1460244 RepID=UPI0004527D1E|nr:MFS transporter [Streptomyces sp. PCS3-D2]WKV70156.1 MFS transporter [Streptomyces sp. PCS3-D2]